MLRQLEVAGIYTARKKVPIFSSSKSEVEPVRLTGRGDSGTVLPACSYCSPHLTTYPRSRRHLGGELPSFVELRNPASDTRIKVDVPSTDPGGQDLDYTVFQRDNLIELCVKTLKTIQDWGVIMQRRLDEGARLQLAWRMDTKLDWVVWENDVLGHERKWAVLAGLALGQVSAISIPVTMNYDELSKFDRRAKQPIWNVASASTSLPSFTSKTVHM